MTYTIRIADSDTQFTCAPGQTVVEAALAFGVEIPYSCRKGVCNTCAGRIVSGDHEGGATSGDEVLLCSAHPRSDLTIAPRTWSRVDPAARKRISAKVFRSERLTRDVWSLRLRFPAGMRAKFRAGQYLEVILEDGERRTFSMANPPHENDGVTLHVREIAGGRFTEGVLPKLVAGDTIAVELPYGDFWLREERDGPIVMVAGGTGFAPIASIIEDLRQRRVDRDIRLFWGVRTREDLYARKQIDRWQRSLRRFGFVAALSDEPSGSDWAGARGFVHEAVLSQFDDMSAATVYACGAPAMVDAARASFVRERGLPADAFFNDSFVVGPGAR